VQTHEGKIHAQSALGLKTLQSVPLNLASPATISIAPNADLPAIFCHLAGGTLHFGRKSTGPAL
jgi:hypothetical protein